MALKGVLSKSPELDPASIGDVVWGCANQAGEDNRNVGRMAVLLAGLPVSVTATTVNRLCGSSLDAAMDGASNTRRRFRFRLASETFMEVMNRIIDIRFTNVCRARTFFLVGRSRHEKGRIP